ncbi:chew domain protein [Dyella acidisoli]|uniref:Chew domain protein n=2 Tax=Dyella acidisoli TaxID=1867834 RepID=A0ABQ5XHA4_9GAMM|nr:chew domain protein [Dyella acidisoli]
MDLLDRQLPEEYLQHWTAHLARKEVEAVRAGTQSILVFHVGAEWLAMPTGLFKEVVSSRAVHALPDRRKGAVLGLANIRGELVVCVSLSKLLGLEQTVAKKAEKRRISDWRLMMIEYEGTHTAFLVDDVHGTLRFHPDDLREVPSTLARATATYIKAMLPWQDQTIGILDEQLLIATLNRSLSLATT